MQTSLIELYAVQAKMHIEDYASPAAFASKIASFGPEIGRQRKNGAAIVVFPENIGLFLAASGSIAHLAGARDSDEAFQLLARRHVLRIAWCAARYRTLNPKTAFWLARATEMRDTMISAFSQFALEQKAYVVAGSAPLPSNRYGLQLRPFAPKGKDVFNLSYTFAPDGRLVSETAKVNLVPTMEDDLGLSAGSLADLPVVDTGSARLGTAICYDGFRCAHTDREPGYRPALPHFDRMGADIVAQPSANPWPWDEPWVFNAAGSDKLRREQWLGEGAHSLLPRLSRVRYLVNPQLIFSYLDLNFDGKSYIFGRRGTETDILAAANGCDTEEIVTATVEAVGRTEAATPLGR